MPTAESPPLSVRLPSDLLEMLDRNVALRSYIGKRATRSEVIREALDAYLPQFEETLRTAARELLKEDLP